MYPTSMAAYDSYSKFYDATQGRGVADRYRELLAKYHPQAKSLLEVACGTGAVLQHLAPHFEAAVGLDISKSMPRIERDKLPDTQFFQEDMTGFRLDRTFDVAICPYDSINHLLRFSDWVKTFGVIKRHLSPQGLFVFDMNTEFGLERLIDQTPHVHEFEDGTFVVNVVNASRRISEWQLKVFEREQGACYRLYSDSIEEISFTVNRIRASLNREFRYVRAFDASPDWHRPRKSSRRLFWVCRLSPVAFGQKRTSH